ncbi:hypothetical protein CF326_g5520, partial [Tilletia indica]
ATSKGKDKAKASTSVSTVVARPALDDAPRPALGDAPRRSQVPGIPAHVQGAITRSRMARLKYAARKIATPPSRPASSSSRDKGKGKATTEVSSATAQSSNAASGNPAGPSASTALQSQLRRSSVASSSRNTLDMDDAPQSSSVASSSRHTLDMDAAPPSSSSLLQNETDDEDLDEKDPSLALYAQPSFIALALPNNHLPHAEGATSAVEQMNLINSHFLASVRPPGSILMRRPSDDHPQPASSGSRSVLWGPDIKATYVPDEPASDITRL